jgi:hypothetical protein
MAEVSVIWLLFLGVFLVVVSSGVLAASQWQNFPPTGQYSILLIYTLAFFVAGCWTGQQPKLRLTAQMLQITTLLIVPVNFWMMDGLGLWQSGLGLVVAPIAALTLTAITLFLLRPSSGVQSELLPTPLSRLTALNSIGLSWLHWGWNLESIPLIATYGGTIGTAVLLSWQDAGRRSPAGRNSQLINTPPPPLPLSPPRLTVATLVIALSTLLLISRALLVAAVPLSQLGLALGICGWTWCWLVRPTGLESAHRQSVWTALGGMLLVLGWVVTLAADPPWQAIGVSLLVLWLLVDRLRLTRQSGIVLATFLVGLQTYGLLWRLLPSEVQQSLIEMAAQIVGSPALPQGLLGLAGFPYLWLTLAAANWLRRGERERGEERERGRGGEGETTATEIGTQFPVRPALSEQTEMIAFILGISLTVISLNNPGVRSLNLLLATGTLGWLVSQRSTTSPALIYLTHSVAGMTIISGIDWRGTGLSPIQWAGIFLGMMAIEWGLSLGTSAIHWQRSAWYIGLVLAGCSYALLLPIAKSESTLIWLIAPSLLTGLSRSRQFSQPQLAAWLSVGALCAQLLLLSTLHSWIIAFAVATLLMLLNTQTLCQLIPAALTIGFGLGLELTLIWRWWAEQMLGDTILLVLSAMLWQLWFLRDRLSHPHGILNSPRLDQHPSHPTSLLPTSLHQLYAAAANGWGIAFCVFTLLLLTGLSAVAFTLGSLKSIQLFGGILVIGALGYRVWQQPTNLGFWGLAWAVEAGVAMLVAQSGSKVEALGIVNIGLGWVCQWGGEVWTRRSPSPYRSSWHAIPLVYAAFGLWVTHDVFNAYTGLYTLVAALVGIGIGRRHVRFQPLTLLAVLLISLAAYELLIYQLLQARGGSPGDGFTLLAGLSILMTWTHRLTGRWLLSYLRLTYSELQWIPHLHWLLGSGLALLAVLNNLSAIGTGVLLLTALALSVYALAMGNRKFGYPGSGIQYDAWTYAGIAELLATIGYGLYEMIPDTTFLLAGAGAMAAVVALGLYLPPWQTWGWSGRPWRHAAVLLPAIVILLTASSIALQSLLIAAAFYAWVAKAMRQIRWSYLSLLLFDWALLRFVQQQSWLNLLWGSGVLGGSLLYVAQLDPGLHSASARAQRHWLRSLATSLVCVTALYQAEVEIGGMAIGVGLLTLIFSLGLIFIGLMLRVRAFLYVGTAAFVWRILRWLWLFINTYSLLLWAIGIVLGMIFIWLAATFEARRSQVHAVVQYWSSQLEHWE